MKYKWKRYWVWICLLSGAIIILSISRATNSITTDIFIGITVTFITLFISIITHFQEADRFFKELFTEFNQRYDKMNHFLNQVKEGDNLIGNEKQKVIDYINLCAEEYMWVKKGRIPEHIWESWKNGIEFHLKKEPLRKIFEEERLLWKSSYYGFFDEI